jgi:hypothetical protein
MKFRTSSERRGIVGICGHAGVGHIHSHSGFVQDDSGGFAAATELLKAAFPTDTTVRSAEADLETGFITVTTGDGGVGKARARRGVTPYEAELLGRAAGRDASFTQALAFAVFGRIYGQGVLEVPVALQAAAALAVVDTFEKKHPGKVKTAAEDLPGNIGRMMGAVLDIDGVPAAVLAVVNATEGGLGPVEDLEGNVILGDKGRLMKELGLDTAPTIVVEGKAYVPGACENLKENTFWIRHNSLSDSGVTAECLAEAAAKKGFPYRTVDSAFPRGANALEKGTRELGEKIASLGRDLAEARTSREKVRLVGDLALLVSQDAGGVTFMSDAMQDVVGSAGMVPGTTAVISLIVTSDYIRRWKIPELSREDTGRICEIIAAAVPLLAGHGEEARKEMAAKRRYREGDFAGLLKTIA